MYTAPPGLRAYLCMVKIPERLQILLLYMVLSSHGPVRSHGKLQLTWLIIFIAPTVFTRTIVITRNDPDHVLGMAGTGFGRCTCLNVSDLAACVGVLGLRQSSRSLRQLRTDNCMCDYLAPNSFFLHCKRDICRGRI